MGVSILYILSMIFLISTFMIYKKSENKLNFIKWLIVGLASIYGYNILIGMIFGLLNITLYIWLLSIINILVGCIFIIKPIKNRKIQKYTVSKLDIAGITAVLILFGVMFVKDLYITDGDITHYAVDSAIHYRAAKHYSDNLKIFINVEDKSFFNFNVMQTGAYINDGIFMNVIHNITNIDYAYLYQLFESITLFMCGLTFYAFFMDKIKTKRGLISSLFLLGLYLYGYPYNSWIFGFSYLSVGIMATTLLLSLVEFVYSEDKINKKLSYSLIVICGMCLTFSYCLFVPAVFSAICIYCFLKDILNKDEKKYLKFFGKNTLIITILLLIVTAFGIGYLFIPTFFIKGQTNLISALKIDGAIYSEKYVNFIAYLPFAAMYFVEIIKRIKLKSLRYQDVFSIFVVGFTALLYIGMMSGHMAKYYMLKMYFILWTAVFAAIIDIVNENIDKKIFRLDGALLFLLFVVLLVKRVSAEMIFRIYIMLVLFLFTVLPEIINNIDLSGFKKLPKFLCKKFEIKRIRVAPYVYVILWGIFVCSWAWIKAGHILGEVEKHSLPNLVGMYYIENCEHRKQIDLEQNFNANELKLARYAKENLKDMNVENTELITMDYYPRVWAVAVLEYKSDTGIPYEKVIQDTTIYTVEDALKDPDKKYIVKLVSKHQDRLEAYNKLMEEVRNNKQIEILYENDNGFVAKINH